MYLLTMSDVLPQDFFGGMLQEYDYEVVGEIPAALVVD